MENSHFDHHHRQPLHHCHVHKLRATLNRTYTLLHILALAAIFYYRASFFFHTKNYYLTPLLPWLLIFASELLISFLWILKQPIYWRPVTRTAFPENLPKDEQLPGIDVFICTADPNKEPTFEVMNTVVSAMALGYPAEKLSVYLSDDGGASVTLNGMKEAWLFATWWLPFCRRYNIKTICPQAYFEGPAQEEVHSKEFIEDRKIVKEKYETFKQRIKSRIGRVEIGGDAKRSAQDHPPQIQVVNEKCVEDEEAAINPENVEMPLLVYVAREKRPSCPHHFKAGALNVLLRVSSILSNSPYILVLDCDMYCNDSTSARQAMCFYLDQKISSSLAWVQFPQKFHNICDTDIYDSQMRLTWPVYWSGLDGLQGPIVSGTNFYIRRKALYGININDDVGNDIKGLRDSFGPSNELIKSLSQSEEPNEIKGRNISSILLQETQFLASCTYYKDTKWGSKVGFQYESVLEDALTSFMLHNKGWRSVYLNPQRPQFLGAATTNLNELLTQGTRWIVGLLQLGLSKYCPLIYGSSKMQILQRMFYAWLALFPLDFFPALCFGTILPICFFYGIPLYPKVSDPLFIPFAFLFISSRLKHLLDDFIAGGSTNAWFNEQSVTMIKGITCYAFGTLEFVKAKFGFREASFIPTNKAGDNDTTKWYQLGKYDFRTSNIFLVPLVAIVILNLSCFVAGLARVLVARNWEPLFAQMFFTFYASAMSFRVIEGMLLRKDNASVPLSTTLKSMLLSKALLCLAYFLL